MTLWRESNRLFGRKKSTKLGFNMAYMLNTTHIIQKQHLLYGDDCAKPSTLGFHLNLIV